MGRYFLNNFSSKNIYGTMNSGTVNLTNITDKDREMLIHKYNLDDLSALSNIELTKEDKAMIFREHRKALGEAKGFDWKKMFMADQTKKNGSYFEITKDYVEANPNGWTDIPEDILMVSYENPGVVIGHPVADCPVIMMNDMKNGVVAVGHCSAELIDKKMPMMIADALVDAYGTKEEDLSIMVSACAGNEWTYDSYPKWATDKEFWKDCIIFENDMFKIDLRKAIKKQFEMRKISEDKVFSTVYNLADTLSDKYYYSNAMARTNKEKYGRQFEGAFWKEESKVKSR